MSDPVFTCLDCGERFASRGAAFKHVDAAMYGAQIEAKP